MFILDVFIGFSYDKCVKDMNVTYRTIIEPDTKGFHGFVPALRGCHTWGKTIAETKKFLQEAITLYVEDLVATGDTVPNDLSFESFETVEVPRARRRLRGRQYA